VVDLSKTGYHVCGIRNCYTVNDEQSIFVGYLIALCFYQIEIIIVNSSALFCVGCIFLLPGL